MTKKKRKGPTLEQQLQRPWCYYCERDFDDMMILTSHQKAKHFKCERCGRRLNTAGGLSVHLNQVHKEQLEKVENALPNRGDPSIEIFGTEGIPEDAVRDHQQRVIQNFHQDAAAHRARTGNPQSGTKDGHMSKRPKLPPPEELKQQLREYVAKKNASGLSNGTVAPTNAPNSNASIQGNATNPATASDVTKWYQNGFGDTPQFSQVPPGQQPQPGFPPPTTASSPPNAGIGQPPGLPQRPQQAAPPVSNWQQMHQGHIPTSDPWLQKSSESGMGTTVEVVEASSTTRQAAAKASEASGNDAAEKKSRKGPPARLKVNRKDVSPEESLASMGKYFFDVNTAQPRVLGKVHGAVTGTVDDIEMRG